jgi:hypothetical protein
VLYPTELQALSAQPIIKVIRGSQKPVGKIMHLFLPRRPEFAVPVLEISP